MSLLRDCEFLNASVRQGNPVVDRCRERRTATVLNHEREGRPCTIDRDKKHERCPDCGGMVILPCLACSLERWQNANF
ncbi:hypothetical protein LCGC14_1125380 [marine sediment metagenome]|uniref:Uncharacterized protein n=1 Tax=marine sediment metagenome TaxID=412755 RepID=A0A0F9Q8I2_9ZZZZ